MTKETTWSSDLCVGEVSMQDHHCFHQCACPCSSRKGNPISAKNILEHLLSVISQSRTFTRQPCKGLQDICPRVLKTVSEQRCREKRTVSCHRQATVVSRVKVQRHSSSFPLQSYSNYCRTKTLWFELVHTNVELV